MSKNGSGALLHAKHSFMPNKLGYCGPDDRGIIQRHLQESSVDEKFVSILKNFEAAYPFIRLIGTSNQRDPFDHKVAEAYWIGNKLLNNVATKDYYNFTLSELRKKNTEEIKTLFLKLRDLALPHHIFYVISTALNVVSDHHHTASMDPGKVSETMDNCMISWGKVVKVEKDNLLVNYNPLRMDDEGKIFLDGEVTKKVSYDPTIPQFDRVSRGDCVSLHWNYACEILSKSQMRNIRAYTMNDIDSANAFLKSMKRIK
jgi:hypothetical protein